jgi:hypothetical protein
MAGILTYPEKSTTATIDGLDDSFGNTESRHIVERQSTKHRSAESEPVCSV